MRVGIFVDTYLPYLSGVTISVKTQKEALEKQGIEVFLVTVNLENNEFIYDEKQRIIKLPGFKSIFPGTKNIYFQYKKVQKILDTWKLDIIHTQTESQIGIMGKKYALESNIPLVHTYHTLYEDYTHYVLGSFLTYPKRKIAIYLTKRFCNKGVRTLVVPTEKIKDKFIYEYKLPKDIVIISNGFNLERFYEKNIDKNILKTLKQKFNIRDEDFKIAYLGRIAEEKNIDLLLNAMTKLVKFKRNIKLIICGGGSYLETLKQKAIKLKITKNVIWTDRYELDDAPYYFRFADLFAMASSTETQGMTVIESLACGTPVLCLNDPAYVDVVKEDENGYLFENEEEFVDKIKTLYFDHKKVVDLKRNAPKGIERYDSSKIASEIIKIYKKHLKK